MRREYCVFIEGNFEMPYLNDLKRLPFKVVVRRIESELPAYLIIRCNEEYVKYLYNNFLWIKRIERNDPMPVFWNDWSDEEEEEGTVERSDTVPFKNLVY